VAPDEERQADAARRDERQRPPRVVALRVRARVADRRLLTVAAPREGPDRAHRLSLLREQARVGRVIARYRGAAAFDVVP
jgi:hypothetical protein